jgi:hypothetical protein
VQNDDAEVNMKQPHPARLRAALAALLVAAAGGARADAQSDLRAALVRLAGTAPVKGTLDVATTKRHGEGKDAFERTGRAAIEVEDGPRGLQIRYAADVLARLDAESRASGKDPEAITPTVDAVKEVDATGIVPLLAAARALGRQIDVATFKSERVEAWRGQPARVLRFAIPMESLSKEQRKYVRHFDGTLDVWIAADGTPLASVQHVSLSGRALVVIGFEAKDDVERTYAVTGDRLVVVRDEHHDVSSGGGQQGEEREVKSLALE